VEVVRTDVQILFEGRDVMADVGSSFLSLTYTDNETGKSDEIELSFEDRRGLWRDRLFPTKGDRITVKLTHRKKLRNFGEFELDQPQFTGFPDVVTIRGVATDIKKELRDIRAVAWENTSLQKIAATIAANHGLTLVGEIYDFAFDRLTQNESDLAFLSKLAADYGHIFKVADGKLVFYDIDAIEVLPAAVTIDYKDLKGYDLKVSNVIKGVQVTYWHPKTKRVITHTFNNPDIQIGGVMKVEKRFENIDQARRYARSQFKKQANAEITGSLTIPGDLRLAAGVNATLTGMGKLEGVYHAGVVRQQYDGSGLNTILEEIRKIG